MLKMLSQKTAETARAKKEPYQIHDTAITGFVLRVQPSGAKIWKLLRKDQKPVTLGRFPTITFEMAQGKAGRILRGEDDTEQAEPMTFGKFVERHYEPFVKANHSRPDETLKTLSSFGIDDKLLADKTLAQVETWRIARQQLDLSPATINRQTATLHAALQKAVEWDLIEENPLARLKRLKIDKRKRVRYLAAEEESRLLTALVARDDRKRAERESANQWRRERGHDPFPGVGVYADNLTPLVIVALNTGLRRGELWNLIWGDVDLKRQVLTVHGRGAKSGQTRHIPLNNAAVKALKNHRGEVAPLPSIPVFGRQEFRKAWAGVLKSAKITSFRFHDVRHSFASKLVMAGVPLNTVRELMGHATLEMTLVYAHLAPDNLRAAVELL